MPVHVRVDQALLTPVAPPALPPDPVDGEDVAEDIEAWKGALKTCNDQLDAIEKLQPKADAPPP